MKENGECEVKWGQNDLTKRKSESVLLWDKKKIGEPNEMKEKKKSRNNRQMRKIVVKATHVRTRTRTHTHRHKKKHKCTK